MALDRRIYMVPNLLMVFVLSSLVIGSWWLGAFLTSVVFGVLVWFHFPQVDSAVSDNILQPHKFTSIAHRGAGLDLPENSISAFRLAKKNGATAIEFDLEYTSDGVPIILHDDTVDRTSDGTGRINGMSWDEARKLNIASKHPQGSQCPNEHIPTLEEAIQTCLQLGLRMYIDVKSNAKMSAEVLSGLYKKYPEMYNMAIVCSFWPWIIYKVRQVDSRICTGLTWRPWFLSCQDIDGPWRKESPFGLLVPLDLILQWSHFSWLWFFCGNSAVLLCKDVISRRTVHHFERVGIQVVVWTVNDDKEKHFLSQTLKVPLMTDSLICHEDSNRL